MKNIALITCIFVCLNVTAQTATYQTVTLSNSGDGASLLVFNTERPWVLKQTGTGPSTHLQLQNHAGPNKHFQIKTDGGFHLINQANNYNTYLSANGGNSYISSLGGYVGIGTSTPSSQVHIFGNSQRLLKLENDLNYDAGIEFKNNLANFKIGAGIGNATNSFVIYDLAAGQPRVLINANGNFGVGTTSPDSKLDIQNPGEDNELLRLSTERPWVFRQTSTGSTSQLDLHSTVSDKNFKVTSPNNNRSAQFLVSDNPSYNKVFLVPDGGNVGIGTTNVFGYKLAVNGTIGAKEVKVENTSAWPDYVFENDYDLRKLEEVERFVQENKHLPEIPSEREIDENGINLGEMDAKLLKKVEELTLYMIEMNKRVHILEKENMELKNEIEQIKGN